MGDPGKRGKQQLKAKLAAKIEAAAKKVLQANEKKPAPVVRLPSAVIDSRISSMMPDKPDFLIPEAVECWDNMMPDLVRSNNIRSVDSLMLGFLFNELGWALHFERKCVATGSTAKQLSGPRRGEFVNTMDRQKAKEHRLEAVKLMKDLGLLPGQRRKSDREIPSGEEEAPEDERSTARPAAPEPTECESILRRGR